MRDTLLEEYEAQVMRAKRKLTENKIEPFFYVAFMFFILFLTGDILVCLVCLAVLVAYSMSKRAKLQSTYNDKVELLQKEQQLQRRRKK